MNLNKTRTMSEATLKDAQHFWIVWQINWQIITINLSLLVSVFIKANGLAFVSGPDKITINATTGSSQTFTWQLKINQEHKKRELKAQFGPWNRGYKYVNPIITFSSSGNAPVHRRPENRMSRRLYWVGDWKRGYYIAFQLVNIQRDDAGDYGVKLRVDNYAGPPLTLQSWFTLKVEVPKNNLIVFFCTLHRGVQKQLNYHFFFPCSLYPSNLSHQKVYKTHIVRHRILFSSDNQTICTLLSDR